MEAKRETRPHVGSPYMDDEIPEAIEASLVASVNLKGDVSGMSARDREAHYLALCKALGLNPLTQPLQWVRLNGKEVLYVGRGATDQLAARHGLNRKTIRGPEIVDLAGSKVALCVVEATLPNGRSETATATLPVADPANLYMKLETKAKRRATLSILGLGLLDETELETIPGAERIDVRQVPTLAPPPVEEPAEPRTLGLFAESLGTSPTLAVVPGLWHDAIAALRAEGHHPEDYTDALSKIVDGWLDLRGYVTLSAADRTALCGGVLPADVARWHDQLSRLQVDGDPTTIAAESWLASRWSSLDAEASKPYRLALSRWLAVSTGTDTRAAGAQLGAAVKALRDQRAAAVDALTTAPARQIGDDEGGDDSEPPPSTPTPRKGRQRRSSSVDSPAEDTSWQSSPDGMRAHAASLPVPQAVLASARRHYDLVGYGPILADRLVALTPPDSLGAMLSRDSAGGLIARAQREGRELAQRRAA